MITIQFSNHDMSCSNPDISHNIKSSYNNEHVYKVFNLCDHVSLKTTLIKKKINCYSKE